MAGMAPPGWSPGKMLIGLGLLLVVAGIVIGLGARLPFRPGRLPGDFVYRGRNTTFYFPLATSLLVSALLSLLMWLINRR
jgi:hypothetical protein